MSDLVVLAKANVEAAQSNLMPAKAQYKNAKASYESATKLHDAVVVAHSNTLSAISTQNLYDSCQKIDFRSLFKKRGRGPKAGSGSRQAVGDLFVAVDNHSNCLCFRYLLEACQLGRIPGDLRLHALADVKDNTIYLSEDPHGNPWYTKAGISADLPWIPYFWIQVGLQTKTGKPYVCISLDDFGIENTDGSASISDSLPHIRGPVEGFNGLVSIEIVRTWIATCNRHDPTCDRSSLTDQANFVYFLTDVHSRHIMRASSGWRYVALSYVWGKGAQTAYEREKIPGYVEDVDEIETGVKVPCPAAQTIEDAMTFFKDLGGKYVWPDLYCVDQNDDAAKQEQIKDMDKVYASVYLTIVALGGEHADWGLPGISRPLENTKQPTLELGKGRLTATYICSIYDHMGESA